MFTVFCSKFDDEQVEVGQGEGDQADSQEEDVQTRKKNLNESHDASLPVGFFRRFGIGFFMLALFVLMLAGSCFMVYLFSYQEAYIVKNISKSKNMAIKAWVLSKGNVKDFDMTEELLLRNYPSPDGEDTNGK